ncbi:MAG: lysophospholipid acyltransferase family protein [Chloroflexota bacterium]|nr:lysophospholipid acyltransferase family protein [Chloroflexota bacterium]
MDKKYARICKMLSFALYTLGRMEVQGVENIPSEGGCILALNHISRLDTPLTGITSPRQVYALVAAKYKSYPLFSWFIEAIGGIWVQRTQFSREPLMTAIKVLKRGDVLGLAPEGTRSPHGALQLGKPGVAFIAAHAGVPIVPVGITGTQKMSDLLRLRRMRLSITYGEPFYLPKKGRLSSEELAAATELIMVRIAALLPPAYRGVYAEKI